MSVFLGQLQLRWVHRRCLVGFAELLTTAVQRCGECSLGRCRYGTNPYQGTYARSDRRISRYFGADWAQGWSTMRRDNHAHGWADQSGGWATYTNVLVACQIKFECLGIRYVSGKKTAHDAVLESERKPPGSGRHRLCHLHAVAGWAHHKVGTPGAPDQRVHRNRAFAILPSSPCLWI